MNEHELIRYHNFLQKRAKNQYLITRALVRNVLSFYVKTIQPEEWHFSTNVSGKPFIQNTNLPIPIHFNISHTNETIVLAICTKNIGIDIEWHRRNCSISDISRQYFSTIETEQLSLLSNTQKNKRFFELWTIKEAFIKANGNVLSVPLDQITAIYSKYHPAQFSITPPYLTHSKKWNIWTIKIGRSHICAIALESEQNNMDIWSINYNLVIPFKQHVTATFQHIKMEQSFPKQNYCLLE